MIFEQEDGKTIDEDMYIRSDGDCITDYAINPVFYWRDKDMIDARTYVYNDFYPSVMRWYT